MIRDKTKFLGGWFYLFRSINIIKNLSFSSIMESKLKSYLDNLGVQYKEHKHPAVFTVEEHHKISSSLPEMLHTKNLFLKDNKNSLFLVCMYANKQLDLRSLKEKLNAKKKLSFASPDLLKEHLSLTPGSVSIFGMIHAKNVKLIVDKQVWDAQVVGFHPNINTSTLELSHEDLERFYNSLKAEKEIINLDDNES